MRYRLAIFDFDGTLADSFPWFARVINEVADRYRFCRVTNDEVETLRGMSARQIVAHLGVPSWKLPLIAAHMRRRKAREIGETKLFPGAQEMLLRLAEGGIAIFVVSSNAEHNVRQVMGPSAVRPVRSFACGVPVFGKARRFRDVVRASGFPAQSAIAIGDEIRDIEAARAAGIAAGAVAWGYTRADALRKHAPDLMFESFADIPGRLLDAGPTETPQRGPLAAARPGR